MHIAVPIAALLIAGCGSAVVERSEPATPPYAGPLDAQASVAALECDGETPYERGEHRYDDGLAKVKGSPEAALDDYVRESGPLYTAPADGYAVEVEEAGRVLLSYDVDGRTKVSMLVVDGVRDWNGDEGWGVRAWAQCDPSELAPAVTDDLGIGVWEHESGRRVPVTRIQSFQGSEHCSWEDITFLLLGPKATGDWYLRDAGNNEDFSGLLRTTFSDEATLPEGATDTGWRRGGRQLWIGPDNEAAYLVSLDDAHDVERWPAAKQRIGCAYGLTEFTTSSPLRYRCGTPGMSGGGQNRVRVAKVLIIEDDDVIAQGMARHLTTAGFDPLWVNKGESGLARLRYERPDVCILDLMLPGVDGWKLIEVARAEGIGTPIVVVSARGTEHDRVHALEIGADDYLVKPFSMKELVARVRAAARRGIRVQDERRGEPIEIEELKVDPLNVQAYVRGDSAELTPTEFRLLYALALEQGRVVTRDELLQKVWGRRLTHRDRTVDVFVRKIRDKLESLAPAHTFIQTRYGVGYKLEAVAK
jgi:DNA-binding response OmpR family regulator